MGLACKLGRHKWNGCTCTQCGKRRQNPVDADHDWQPDGDCARRCARCGKTKEEHCWLTETACLDECVDCGKKRIHHQVGALKGRGYDVSEDLYYTDYRCQRCGRAFRTHDAYHNPAVGDDFLLGTAGVIDKDDKAEMGK